MGRTSSVRADCEDRGPAARGGGEAGSEKPTRRRPAPGREVLERMVAAYRKASSYADAGVVHLLAEAGGKKIQDKTGRFSLDAGPSRTKCGSSLRGDVVCDGKKLYASINDLPGQVLLRAGARAPDADDARSADRILAKALTQALAGPCRR